MTALLRDRYEPLETVGRGGQGEVIRALDHLHGNPVAIKIRPVRWPAEREEILDEARLLRALRPHPGVTLVREDFFDADRYVMVMDWIEGRPLSRALEEEGALPLGRVAALLEQAAAALDHMHAHDPPIIHGDVKPANLVLSPDGHLVLVDFGVAVRGSDAPRMATSRYAAPEIARGDPVTRASDVYSLAATAITLLTGEPFVHGIPPRWPDLPRAAARKLERALAKGLHPDPKRRPPSAGALVSSIAPPREAPSNLPAALTSFVGRRRELREGRALLRRARLVTLAGPGGVGKTRLALVLGETARAEMPGGVWLAALAPLADPTLIGDEIARALGVGTERGRSAEERVVRFLGTQHALLVLDNAEHLVEAAADAARRLLQECPALTILVTSRVPLGVPGEAVLRVEPLGLSHPSTGPDAARRSDAVRLFCERARAARRSFRLTRDAAPAVEEICRRLDGIPLAIELAAARMAGFEPAELAARLDERFGLLRAEGGETLPHHRTLHAAIEWSHDLLTPAERALLARLAVFAGRFPLDAACNVCTGEGIAPHEVPALLGSLVERSLVMREAPEGKSSYRLLETVREYAREKLEDSADAVPVRRQHLAWLAGLAEGADAERADGTEAARLARLAEAMDDVRAALAWCAEPDGDARAGLELACAFAHLWLVHGNFAEGRSSIERALAAAGDSVDDPLRAQALNDAGDLARSAGEYALAESLLEESRALRLEMDDRRGTNRVLNSLGVVAMYRGDNERARALFEECVAIGREIGEPALYDGPIGNLGIIALADGDHERARALHEESLAIARQRGDEVGVAYSLQNLAIVAQERGDHTTALTLYRQSLEMLHRLGDKRAAADCLLQLGEMAMNEERFEEAARLIGAADGTLSEIGAPLPEYARPEFERVVAAARAGAGEDAFLAAWRAGRAAPLDDVVRAVLRDD